jgi:hypothetical protein
VALEGCLAVRSHGATLPLTFVLLHECPHVPLFGAVCKGAVPHVLALAAILCMDAELWVGRDCLLSSAGLHHCLSHQDPSRDPAGTTALCIQPQCSHHIAVGNCEWMAVASPTPISSWPWTSPEGPAAPWSSCRKQRELIGDSSGWRILVCLSLGLLPHHTLVLVPTYQCRALALQYLRSLSGSTTCPFLQHWPHTNFICKSKVLGPCVLGAPCWGTGSDLVEPKAQGLRP